jgi:hypothetical protein
MASIEVSQDVVSADAVEVEVEMPPIAVAPTAVRAQTSQEAFCVRLEPIGMGSPGGLSSCYDVA